MVIAILVFVLQCINYATVTLFEILLQVLKKSPSVMWTAGTKKDYRPMNMLKLTTGALSQFLGRNSRLLKLEMKHCNSLVTHKRMDWFFAYLAN